MLHITTKNSQGVRSLSTSGEQTSVPVDTIAGFITCTSGDAMHTTLIEFTNALCNLRKAFVQVSQQLVASMQSLVHTVRKLTEWLHVSRAIQSTPGTDSILDCSRKVTSLALGTGLRGMPIHSQSPLIFTLSHQEEIGVRGNVSRKFYETVNYSF
jgi:hypothetical protein